MNFGAGECPLCGAVGLEYGEADFDDNCEFPWTCQSCGATGIEVHAMEFVEHRNVEEHTDEDE